MLPKHSRLTKETIEAHIIRARRIKTPRFLILYTTIAAAKLPQVSFTVSKKVAKIAVLRNKLRRRGYAAVRSLIPRISTNAAILISYSVPDCKVSLGEIAEELAGALAKTGLYKK